MAANRDLGPLDLDDNSYTADMDLTVGHDQDDDPKIKACYGMTHLNGAIYILVPPTAMTMQYLSRLEVISGNVTISNHVDMLSSQQGFLANLRHIGCALTISFVVAPVTLPLFKNLHTVGDIAFTTCPRLEKTIQFPSLRSAKGIEYRNCPLLVDIDGFPELKNLGTLGLYNCQKLSHVTGFPRMKQSVNFKFNVVPRFYVDIPHDRWAEPHDNKCGTHTQGHRRGI
jgi:hypothetical protein